MTFVGDSINSMTLDGPRGTKIEIQQVEGTTLVVSYKGGSYETKCHKAITEAAKMVKSVCLVLSNFNQTKR